jgi:hypothetical protein
MQINQEGIAFTFGDFLSTFQSKYLRQVPTSKQAVSAKFIQYSPNPVENFLPK